VSNHEVTIPSKQAGTLNVSKNRYSSEKMKFYLSINTYAPLLADEDRKVA